MNDERTFRELCCERYGVPMADFEEWVFWRCVPPRRLWLAKIQWQLKRGLFTDDLYLLQNVADCRTQRRLRAELNSHRMEHPATGFSRKTLGLRLSGKMLLHFAAQLLP